MSSRRVQELVESVKFDLYIKELQKSLANASKPPSLKCNVCSLSEFTKLLNCSNCHRIFCENCQKNTDDHRCRQTISIPIQPDADPVTLAISAQFGVDHCTVHNKSRDYFCITCDTPLCAFCLLDKQAPHAGHDMLDRAHYATKCGDIEEVLEYATTVESHQTISAKICLEEIAKLKSTTERNAVIWLAFADRVSQFLERFIQNRIGGFARAKAQHLLAQGAAASDAAATNCRLISYLKTVKGAEPESIDGILAHNVIKRLKAVADEPAVLAGYTNRAEDQVPTGVDSEQFDGLITKFKDLLEEMASSLSLSEEATVPSILAATLSLQPLKSSSSEDIDRNKEYQFQQQVPIFEEPTIENCPDVPVETSSLRHGGDFAASNVLYEQRTRSRTESIHSDMSQTRSATSEPDKPKDYPPSLKLSSGEHVLISSLKSPTDFHVNKLRTTNLFQRINNECAMYGKLPEKGEVRFEINDPCLAVYGENKRWYRSRIVNARLVDPNRNDSKEFLISYVDFGNKEWIPDSSGRLHSISSALLSHPPQAIRCSLYNIVPATTDGRWSKSACEALENMFGSLSATVCVCKDPASQNIPNAPWQIDLYRNQNSSSKAPESFRDAMIFLGHGSFPTEYSFAPLTPAAMNGDSNQEIKPAPTITPVKPPFQPHAELPLNDACLVAIAHVNTPYDFYVHVLGEETIALTEMNKSLETYAKVQLAATNRSMPALRQGLPVIAPYPADGRYYRAAVLRKVDGPGGRVVVRYIDYGNESPVEAKALLDIPEDFMKLPVQGVRFRLHGIKPSKNGQWSPEATRFLHTKPGHYLDALLLGKHKSQYLAELFEVDDESNTTTPMADAMVTAGVAVPDTDMATDFGSNSSENSKPTESKSFVEPRPSALPRNDPLPKFVPPVVKVDPHLSPSRPAKTPTPKVQSPSYNNKTAASSQPEIEKEPQGIEVQVTHVINPADFYIRPVKLNRLVERIERTVKLLVDGNLVSSVAAAVNGDLVCVCDLDGSWKRGRVSGLTTVTDLNDSVTVFLLDYGYSVSSTLSNLCRVATNEVSQLAASFWNLPHTVFNCALDGIKPAGMGGKTWSRKATEIFGDQVGLGENKGKPVECWGVTSSVQVVDCKPEGRIPLKLLVKTVIPATPFTLEGRRYVSVAGKLIEDGVALSEISLISADALASQLLAKTLETFQFSMPSNCAEIVSKPVHLLTVDLLMPSPETTNGEAISKDEPSGAVVKEACYFPRVDILGSDLQLPVKIKQAILHSINTKAAIFHFAEKESIDDLNVKCQEVAENLLPPTDVSELKVGTFVLAMDMVRGWWCRGVIKHEDDEDDVPESSADASEQKFLVYFVDLGISSAISTAYLRIPPKSAETDELALIHCAHFPLIFPLMSLATSFTNSAVQFVETVHNFVFTLHIFAQLKENIFDTAHSGYLGQAVVNYRPPDAEPSSPSLNVELGNYLVLQTMAYEKDDDEKLLLAYRTPCFQEKVPSPVLISHVEKPDIVWLQRRTETTESCILKMKAKIIQYAESTKPPTIDAIVPWMPLVVQWPIDQGWYRAVCKRVTSGEFIHVCFVDYGNEDHVPLSCCRIMPMKMYSREPPYAIKGRISKLPTRLQFEKLINICCFARSADSLVNSVLPIFELLQEDTRDLNNFVPLQ